MTIKKKAFSFIMFIIITFVSVTGIYFESCVYADSLVDYGDMFSTFVRLVGANDDVPINVLDSLVFDAICPRDAGFMVRTAGRVNYEITKKAIATYLNKKYSNQDKTKDNITQSDINEYSRDLYQNVTYTDNSTTYNDYSRDMVNLAINDYISSSVSYGYFYDLQKSLPLWGADVGAYAKIFAEYPDWYHELWKNGQGQLECVLIKPTSNIYLVRKGYQGDQIKTDIYKGTITNGISSVEIYSGISEDEFMAFTYIDGVWTKQNLSYPSSTSSWTILVSPVPDVGATLPPHNFGKYVTTKGEKLPLFGSYNDLVNYIANVGVGKSTYYINQPVYNNWSQSAGDYIVTNDNSNKVTYGNVNTYIDDHHTETGDYPSVPDINVWIESQNPVVTPTPVPTGSPSQGGSFVNNNNPSITNNPTFNNNPNINITLFPSVSDNGLNGGTVSGNGGQGSIGNIFDWLGNLGNVIASLIKNVGEMIVNALQGVVEAVTTILSDIPNILTPMIEFVFGGLPDEIKALITLGITCIIFVGIIKALKR